MRLALLLSLGLSSACNTQGAFEPAVEAAESAAFANLVVRPHEAMCAGLEGGYRWRCNARLRTDSLAKIDPFAAGGLGATDLQAAYALDPTRMPNATVAIVDAYGYPNAESDLAVYRSQYGLPACTVASGCLKIVNQNGLASPLPPSPPAGNDWTGETALDLDMASAGCPNCKLLLLLADDDQGDGLMIAQESAAKLGATVISNSWGGPETAMDLSTQYEHYFKLSTPAGIFVATGDSGYNDAGQGPDYPGTSGYVIGVGGTSLVRTSANARGWSEKAWSGGGSGCSLSLTKPSWQGTTGCTFRASSDVSAVGDPSTGVVVYHAGRFEVIGGTSASSPLAAAIFALTGHGMDPPSFAYGNAGAFWDVTSGSNGSCASTLCKSGAGWDGPTGMGTPNGTKLGMIAPASVDMAAPPDLAGAGSGGGGDGGGDDGGIGGVGGGPTGGGGSGNGNGNGNGNGSGNGDGQSSGCSIGGEATAVAMWPLVLIAGALLARRRRS